MKKILLTIGTLAFVLTGAYAQSIYDVERYAGNDLNGTARYVGMGGAMGALGGDISTMGTNPAGIGIYRSNDFMTTFGFSSVNTESNYPGVTRNTNNVKGNIDNVGFVLSNKIGNKTDVRYVNFGFNYSRQRGFNKNLLMDGQLAVSQTELFAAMASSNSINEAWTPEQLGSGDAYVNTNHGWSIGWLPLLGYNAYLINPNYDNNGYFDGTYSSYMPHAGVRGDFRSEERGGLYKYDFNIAFNVNDVVYIGATLGVTDVDYSKYTQYSETFTDEEGYAGNYKLTNWKETSGTGVDFKLGFIFRPAETSFRVGAAIHTPTWYTLTDRTDVTLGYETFDLDSWGWKENTLKPHDARDNVLDYSYTDYRMITPWKFNLSMGYTIGKNIALGAEYEFAEYSSSKLKYDDGEYREYVNYDVKNMMKGVHTLKLGVEARLVPQFSVRAGYNHITAAFNDNAYYYIPEWDIKTDTDYSNTFARNNFTLGMGYKGSSFYADLAYQYSMYKSDFYPFEDVSKDRLLSATKVNNDRHQLLLTLGVRF